MKIVYISSCDECPYRMRNFAANGEEQHVCANGFYKDTGHNNLDGQINDISIIPVWCVLQDVIL